MDTPLHRATAPTQAPAGPQHYYGHISHCYTARMRHLRRAVLVLTCAATSQAQLSTNSPQHRTGAHSAPANPALQRTLQAIAAESAVSRAHWGISVVRMDGTVAVSLHADGFFQPASNAKLFTTVAAMALLPMDARLRTPVLTFGKWGKDGTLDGELQIAGEGDASLCSTFTPKPTGGVPNPDTLHCMDDLAANIQASGITHITGGIVGLGFTAEPYPTGWEIDDAPWSYGAPVSALNIADNTVTLTVTPGEVFPGGSTAQATVSITPQLPYYSVQTTVFTRLEEPTRIDIDRPIGSTVVRVSGHIRTTPYTQDLSIDEPATYAAIALKAALEKRGVHVDGAGTSMYFNGEVARPDFAKYIQRLEPVIHPIPALPDDAARFEPCDAAHAAAGSSSRCLAAVHTGAPLYDDIVIINKQSQNLHAEAMLRLLGKAMGDTSIRLGSSAPGARVVRAFLTQQAGIDDGDFVLYDGSGLSTHDLVTPRAATKLLRYASAQPWGEQWKSSLPIGGVDGTLKSRFTGPLKGRVTAKTGTLGEARALSGYLLTNNGNTVVFSIMVTGHTPFDKTDEAAMDRMVAAIAEAE